MLDFKKEKAIAVRKNPPADLRLLTPSPKDINIEDNINALTTTRT